MADDSFLNQEKKKVNQDLMENQKSCAKPDVDLKANKTVTDFLVSEGV